MDAQQEEKETKPKEVPPPPPLRLDIEYWLCLREATGCKETPNLKVLVFLLRNLDGRDKITKIIQYGSRVLMWYYMQYDKDSAVAARYGTMSKASQSARKCFHLFKTFEEADRFLAALNDRRLPPWRKNALMAKAAAMAMYWLYDNTVFMITHKLSDYDARKATTRSGLSWTIASVIGMWLALYDLHQLKVKRDEHEYQLSLVLDRTEEQTPEKRSALEELVHKERLEHFTLLAEFIKSFCDLLVAANMNGFDLPLRLTGQKLSDGVTGMAGLTSAVLAVWKVYPLRKSHMH